MMLLTEDQRADNFLLKKPYKREEFIEEIKFYEDTILQIRE